MERFFENINIPTPVIAISATLKMALKSKIVAAPNRQPVRRLPFQMEIKHINYFTVKIGHKAVLKTM
jgi:isoprenylcysteine carboxyl methyltransferase (ICMT) family protein YpbQ